MNTAIQQLLAGERLSYAQCYALFSELNKASEPQKTAIMTLIAAKGESFDEIMAARDVFLKHATMKNIEVTDDIIDLVGTGGDGMGTFNISTAASLVVASCGVRVAKHGGGRVTSRSGSLDVMTTLGIPLYQTSAEIKQSLQQNHYAYLCAPYFNPALKAYGKIRVQLGFPTIFNVLGPLINPLQPKRQVIGVYRKALVPIVARILKETGSIHALVVHADEGLDEFSVSGPSDVAEVHLNKIKEYRVFPESLGFQRSSLNDVLGGTSEVNADIIQKIISGELEGPKRDIVLLNAAAGLFVADKVTTLKEGIAMAREAIVSGRTHTLLHQLQQGA